MLSNEELDAWSRREDAACRRRYLKDLLASAINLLRRRQLLLLDKNPAGEQQRIESYVEAVKILEEAEPEQD